MAPQIPNSIKHGMGRCRTLLEANQAEIEACLQDMASNEGVDLTDEIERLTAEGDLLRRRLATYENAAAVAVERGQDNDYAERVERHRNVARRANAAAQQRTTLAIEMGELLDRFASLKGAYDAADEECHSAAFSAISQARPLGVDGERWTLKMTGFDARAKPPVFEAVAQVLVLHAHEERPAAASRAVERRVATLMEPIVADQPSTAKEN